MLFNVYGMFIYNAKEGYCITNNPGVVYTTKEAAQKVCDEFNLDHKEGIFTAKVESINLAGKVKEA